MRTRVVAVLAWVLLTTTPVSLAADWTVPVNALLAQWERFPVVALGEWHGSEQDAALRRELIANPMFASKVRNVVIEFGNARHQAVLDRYMAGDAMTREQLRPIWRDITTPGGADPGVCEALLVQLRGLNQRLAANQRIRVLAADPPIDWSQIRDRAAWLEVASRRDAFAADLVAGEVLAKGGSALVIIGAGHLWQKNRIVREENFAARLKRRHPGSLFTVGRVGRRDASEQGENPLKGGPVPRLLLLQEEAVGREPANAWMGLPVPLFDGETLLRDVLDAAIYTGIRDQPAQAGSSARGEDDAEIARRIAITRPVTWR